MDWIITLPKTASWSDYEAELRAVADRSQVMNYRVAHIPKAMKAGDRCFILWNYQVRGWMEITGFERRETPWRCTTTGVLWPSGNYIQRSGPFTSIQGPEMTGFRGIRQFVHEGLGI